MLSDSQKQTAKNMWANAVNQMIIEFPAGSQATDVQKMILKAALDNQLLSNIERNYDNWKAATPLANQDFNKFVNDIVVGFYQSVFKQKVGFTGEVKRS